jgi:glycosyltransferase involved in cell wall biosynthesis
MEIPDNCHIELLLIDNASSDSTPLVINEYSNNNKKFSVKTLFEPRLGKTYALNKAIKSASGEVLAFIDDDHITNKGYLRAVYKAVNENPDYNLFCGKILPNWDGNEPSWVHDTTVYPIRPFPFPHYDQGDSIMEIKKEEGFFLPPGGNLIVRKSLFQKIGFFSEFLGPRGHDLRGGEDIEFIERALKKGERLLYIPDALQYHQIDKSRLTLPYLMQKAYYRSIAAYAFSEIDTKYRIGRIPAYLFRQALSRIIRALFAKNQDARRFYMVRVAATLGEMQARRRPKS